MHREKVGMRQAAVNVYQLRKTQVRLGKFVPQDVTIKHKITSVAEIIDDYLKASEAMMRKSIDDIRQRAAWWKQHLKARPANGIAKNDIENARLELSKSRLPSNGQRQKAGGRSAATVNRYLSTLKAAYMIALERESYRQPFQEDQTPKGEQSPSALPHR